MRHQEHVDNLNASLEKADKAIGSEDHLTDMKLISEEIKLHGNMHINHEFFWENLAPISQSGGVMPTSDSDLMKAIVKGFGSFDTFKYDLSKTTK